MRRVLLAALLLLIAAAGGGAWYALRVFDAPGPLEEPLAAVVPRGGLEEVGEALFKQGVIAKPSELRLAALATRGAGAIHAGELEFPQGASLRQVLAVLRTGKPVQHRLTIPEGLTAAQVAELVDRAEAASGDTPVPAEGSVLPETYSFERGTSRATLIGRGQAALARVLDQAWAQRAPDLPLATPQDALILASIVERETSKPEERPHVAAVYLNRLRLGMRLESDPTVAYAASGGMGALDHGLTRAELARDDPYNTYRVTGLPPTPICMPGAAAIRAATQPATTPDLYFVADGTGGHVFAQTREAHLANVARWRAIERARPAPAAAATPAPAPPGPDDVPLPP